MLSCSSRFPAPARRGHAAGKARCALILLRDNPVQMPESSFDFITSYDAMMTAPADDFVFPDFDERMRATTFYTTGTTGEPKAVAFSHRQLVLHTMGLLAGLGPIETSNRLHNGDVYMPITPMFHVHAWGFPYAATLLGIKQVYAGRYNPANLLRLIAAEVHFHALCTDILQMLLSAPEVEDTDLSKLKMLIGGRHCRAAWLRRHWRVALMSIQDMACLKPVGIDDSGA